MKGNALLKLSDTNQNFFDKRLPNINPEYLPDYGSDTIATSAAVSIKTACIALNSLTTNTLTKLSLETSIDLTNMAGEENG